ncbi:MAG: zf-HC2 domain-containing protein [Desulfitobacteriaceae bacterium]|nr:zf-HC2 domain-containing protein [Desulfitobacteriaceae bacterium]
MKCQEAKQIIYKYIDHELSQHEEKSLSAHLRVCKECSEEYQLALETHSLLQKTLVPVMPPADLTERIMEAYELSIGNNSESSFDRPNSRWERIRESIRKWAGSRQFKTAVASFAVLALVLFGTKLYTPDQKIARVDMPGVDNEPVEQVDPGNQKDPEPIPGTEDDPAPDTEGQEIDGGEPVKVIDEEPPEQPGKKDNTSPGKTVPGGKNVIELPHPTSVQNGTGSVEVVSLVEDQTGDALAPVLTEDGSAVCYTMAKDKSQLWQVDLKAGAEPYKVDVKPEETNSFEKELPKWWPGEIPVDGASVVSRWSPDGKQIAVNLGTSDGDKEGSATGIWLTPADGTAPMQITQTGGGSSLSWSSDGSKMAFTDKSGCLYVLFMRENVLVQVTNAESSFTKVGKLIWTPDNKKIIINGKKTGTNYKSVYMIALP